MQLSKTRWNELLLAWQRWAARYILFFLSLFRFRIPKLQKKVSEEAKLARKQETRQMVIDQLKQEEEWEAGERAVKVDDVDTDDDKADAEAEYEAWKERELSRIRSKTFHCFHM